MTPAEIERHLAEHRLSVDRCTCGRLIPRNVPYLPTYEAHVAAVIAEAQGRDADTLAEVRALATLPPWPTDGYQPYAVEVDGEVHLAVLLDDLRAVLDRDTGSSA